MRPRHVFLVIASIAVVTMAWVGTMVLGQSPPSAVLGPPKSPFEILTTFVTPYDNPTEQITLVSAAVPEPKRPAPPGGYPATLHVSDPTDPDDNDVVYMLIKGPVQQLEKGHIVWMAYRSEGVPLDHMHTGNVALDPKTGRTFIILGILGNPGGAECHCDLAVYQVNLLSEKQPATPATTEPNMEHHDPAATQAALLRTRDVPLHDYGTFAEAFDPAKVMTWPHGQKPLGKFYLTRIIISRWNRQVLHVLSQTDSNLMIFLEGFARPEDFPSEVPYVLGFDPLTLKWSDFSLKKDGEAKSR